MSNFDKVEAVNALQKIFRPGDVFEIRALDASTTAYYQRLGA